MGSITFHDWKGSLLHLLFSQHFTPVCTTELGRAAQLNGEFEKRDTKVIGLSVDPVDSQRKWVTGAAPDFMAKKAGSPGDASAQPLAELCQWREGAGVLAIALACPEISMSRPIQYAASAHLCPPADRTAGALRALAASR
jgi:hypothetical protein